MKTISLLSLALLLFVQPLAAQEEKHEDPKGRFLWEYEMTRDPKTGIVPRDELEKSREIMFKMIDLIKEKRISGAVPNIQWAERGPNNVGGRVRAILFDPNDVNRKKVWVGGVSGGLWYNNDITVSTSSWIKVNDFWDNLAITCIAYDPGDTQTMYIGTGEIGSDDVGNEGQSASGGGGIWKTTNGGTSWAKLTSTVPDYSATATGNGLAFRIVNRIAVNSSGHVFAATRSGLLKSTDFGTSWSAVTGTVKPGDTDFINDVEIGSDDIVYVGVGGGSTFNDVFKSTSAAADNWVRITPTNQTNGRRTEIALAPSTSGASQVIYVVSVLDNGIDYFKRSGNAGGTWTDVAEPKQGAAGPSFVGEQGGYDLILGVKENDPNVLYAGGITSAISINGGTSWKNQFDYNYQNTNIFVDQHGFARRPGFPDEGIISNDGGVYYSSNWGNTAMATPTFSKRVKDLNITQFYSVAMKSTANDGYIMGGAQDNGNQIITGTYGQVGNSYEVQEGDGGLNFIDADNPEIQIVSYTNNKYSLYENGDKTKGVNLEPQTDNGTFINAADYSSANDKLFANNTSGTDTDTKIIVFTIGKDGSGYFSNNTTTTLTGAGRLNVSFIKLGQTAGVLFIGTKEGDVYKATSVTGNVNESIALTKILDKATFGNGFVSCIDVASSDNMLVVTRGNFNVKSVLYSTNGGTSWISKDESGQGLPNIPVRYALINPANTNQVLLATELGVWSTADISAANPEWAVTNENLANVRCDMLKFRSSDNTVAVATHGRGFFTTQLNQSGPVCPNTLVLISTANDVSGGSQTFQAGQTIKASNKITGNANVTMKAGNSVTLEPSSTGGGTTFEAGSGTVFQAYIAGCAN